METDISLTLLGKGEYRATFISHLNDHAFVLRTNPKFFFNISL